MAKEKLLVLSKLANGEGIDWMVIYDEYESLRTKLFTIPTTKYTDTIIIVRESFIDGIQRIMKDPDFNNKIKTVDSLEIFSGIINN